MIFTADKVKKYYDLIREYRTDVLMKEIVPLGAPGVELLQKLLQIHSACNGKNDASICIKSVELDDITMITNAGQIDLLWMMFYIHDDLKYPAHIKKIANTLTCPINVRSHAGWSYKVHYENPHVYKTKPIPLLDE